MHTQIELINLGALTLALISIETPEAQISLGASLSVLYGKIVSIRDQIIFE